MPIDRQPLPVLEHIVYQHAEEAAMLRQGRAALVRAPHIGLELLARHDERIEAHLDGLRVAGAAAAPLVQRLLVEDEADFGVCFVAAVHALHQGDRRGFLDLVQVHGEAEAARRGCAAALGWVAAEDLRGLVQTLLASGDARLNELGLQACRLHQADPGPALAAATRAVDASVRAQAWRCAGELGRIDLREAALAVLADEPATVRFWAAWAACLLGDRGAALPHLAGAALQPGPLSERALVLVLLATPFEQARALARRIAAAATAAGRPRQALRVLGLLGDARAVPGLLERLDDPAHARLAAESLCWITGLDLARDGLETLNAPTQPEPLDDAQEVDAAATAPDSDLAPDADADLPWPDTQRLRQWCLGSPELQAAASAGTRLFGGARVEPGNVQRVLREGSQRMRSLAAVWRTVLQPGRALFPVAAPAARQRRRLQAPGSAAGP